MTAVCYWRLGGSRGAGAPLVALLRKNVMSEYQRGTCLVSAEAPCQDLARCRPSNVAPATFRRTVEKRTAREQSVLQHVVRRSPRSPWRFPLCSRRSDREGRNGFSSASYYLQRCWCLQAGGVTPEARSWAVDGIGYLTLVSERLSPSLSNGPWNGAPGARRRNGLQAHSKPELNRRLLDGHAEWHEERMLIRADELFEQARSISPEPAVALRNHDNASPSFSVDAAVWRLVGWAWYFGSMAEEGTEFASRHQRP